MGEWNYLVNGHYAEALAGIFECEINDKDGG